MLVVAVDQIRCLVQELVVEQVLVALVAQEE
jgi:hypothetical protein